MDIGVVFMCFLVLVIVHPVMVTHILYHIPLWSHEPCLFIVPCIHSLTSHFTATVDPVGIKGIL